MALGSGRARQRARIALGCAGLGALGCSEFRIVEAPLGGMPSMLVAVGAIHAPDSIRYSVVIDVDRGETATGSRRPLRDTATVVNGTTVRPDVERQARFRYHWRDARPITRPLTSVELRGPVPLGGPAVRVRIPLTSPSAPVAGFDASGDLVLGLDSVAAPASFRLDESSWDAEIARRQASGDAGERVRAVSGTGPVRGSVRLPSARLAALPREALVVGLIARDQWSADGLAHPVRVLLTMSADWRVEARP